MNAFRIRYAALPLALVLVLGFTSTGCSNMNRTGKGAVVGAGAGAVIGGVIGRATGSTARGAIIGAAVGGTAGAVIGRQMDKQAAELDRELENASVEPVPGEDGNTAGIAIRFDNNLLFDRGQATLRPGVRADLADLASSLQNYPGHDLTVDGHASTDGPTDFNQTLSENRAQAVANFLSSNGVSRARMSVRGFGESQPLVQEQNEADRELNRRVEIAIFASDAYRSDVQSQYN